jgi:magnesium-transporting ATPase (P-type)
MKSGPGAIGCFYDRLSDMSLLYFPLLIATLVVVSVILCGKLKKKTTLIDGKSVKVSYQNTTTTLVAFIAPLQTLALVLQAVFAYRYGAYIVLALTTIIFVLLISINFTYTFWFKRSFLKKNFTQKTQK